MTSQVFELTMSGVLFQLTTSTIADNVLDVLVNVHAGKKSINPDKLGKKNP